MKISRRALWGLAISPLSTAFVPFRSLETQRDRIVERIPETRGHLRTKLFSTSDAKSKNDATRRQLLGAALPLLSFPAGSNASQREIFDGKTPLADVPIKRLHLPKSAVGREYIIIELKVNGEGPFDFMVDSGLTTEMITPHLQRTLGINQIFKTVKGLGAGGEASPGALVELPDVALCCGKFAKPGADEFHLPLLHAVVSDFPQEHIDPAHDPVEGMLGMEMLLQFDVDFDFPAGRLRLWAPGTAAEEARTKGLVQIPAAVLNETLLLGIRVTSAEKPGTQPMVGILDCGSTFSAVNWAGAELLGLPPKGDKQAYNNVPTILGVGIDGRPLFLPTKHVKFTFCGDLTKDLGGMMQFAQPPESWQPWDPVTVGIGDLPIFSLGLGDGTKPFQGPAALIGLDILSQRRIILEAGAQRRRRIFMGPA